MSVITHIIAAMVGASVGVMAMAVLIVGGDSDTNTTAKVTYKCDGCPYEYDYDCPASVSHCWKDMRGCADEVNRQAAR